MKTKLQVIKSLTETLTFTFSNIPAILRLGWVGFVLSLLLLAGLGYAIYDGVNWDNFAAMEDDAGNPMAFIGDIFKIYGAIFGWFLLSFLVLAPFMVAIKQMAAGTAPAPAGIGYFRFGAREWKFVGANVILFIIAMVLYTAMAFIIGIIFAGTLLGVSFIDAWGNLFTDHRAIAESANPDPSGVGVAIIFLCYIIGVILFIWFCLRASLFTTAAALENRVAPFGAFRLTGGNAWRLLATFVLYSLFLMAVEMVLQFVVIFVMVGGSLSFAGEVDNDSIPWGLFAFIGSVVGVILLVYTMFRVALDSTLTAKMYQSLTRSEEGEGDLVGGLSDEPQPLA